MSTAAPGREPEREALLAQLLEHGILRRTDSQPVLSRDGTSARWMLDSLPVTMSAPGAILAGRLMGDHLRGFDGRQLATFGLTAVPILQSAIVQSDGRYHGLLVRRERKAHGSQKLIEGRIDPNEPVILIEDSIASGTNVKEGIAKLEAAGMRVEGCVALVRFGWEGGCSDLREQGYRVESIFDIFEDLMPRIDGEESPDYNPTKVFSDFRWSDRQADEGLHPAHLARQVIAEYIRSGEVLRPPRKMDRDYDSSGGAWVSLRSRDDIYERHARDGFWHFPGEPSWGPPEDVVRAALLTARDLSASLLDSSYLAVTFFSTLERATVGTLDNDRYGIVVVSAVRPGVMGGALPNMPGIRDEWQQFHHARINNADLYPFEPYIIYRHGLRKFVEPGAPWQPSGVATSYESAPLDGLARYARAIALGHRPEALLEPVLPPSACQIYVTVFVDGKLRGCMGSSIGNLKDDVRELTLAALDDERFSGKIAAESDVAVAVSVLYNELEMGDFSREEVRHRYRHGQQALGLEQGSRSGLLLPFVAAWRSLDAEEFVDEVIDKAGVTRQPYNWRRFDCSTWLDDENGAAKLAGSFRQAAPSLSVGEVARAHVEYLRRNQRKDGSLYFGYYPFDNALYQGIDIARQAHAAWILARAGQIKAARLALKYVRSQPDEPALSLSRDAFIILARCEPGMARDIGVEDLAGKLAATIDRHGRVTTWTPAPANEDDEIDPDAIDPDALQNYVPGHVLLALAAAARSGILSPDLPSIERAFRYYRHRFRYKRDFGQVSWIALAFCAWSRFARQPDWAALVFEVTDWILEFQHEKSGAFLTDHQPDTPGFTTAVYLEAVAAAVETAAVFDPTRSRRYEEAWRSGFAFLDRLIIQKRDSSVLPNYPYAEGGLRENLYSGHVRIDFVQHALAAILQRYSHAFASTFEQQENQHG